MTLYSIKAKLPDGWIEYTTHDFAQARRLVSVEMGIALEVRFSVVGA